MKARFIVIDDEYYVRQRVKHCINWEAIGFELAGEADNVPDALALLEQGRVDLAIVDITMPGENGLDFLRLAQKKSPDTLCIVLSGYADFEFARGAMRYGVESYLTKPVNSDEMRQAVLRAKSRISERRQKSGNNLFLRRFFIQGQVFEERVSTEQLLLCGILPEKNYTILLCDFAGFYFTHDDSKNRAAFENTAIKLLLEELEQKFEVLSTRDTYGHILLIVTEEPDSTALVPLLEQVIRSIEREWDEVLSIGRSRFLSGTAPLLLEAYHEADLALLSKVFHPDARTVLQFDCCPINERFLEPFNRQIEVALSTKNEAMITENLDAIFEKIARDAPSIQLLELELSHLLIIAKSFAARRNFPQLQLDSGIILLGCVEMIAASGSLAEISNRIRELYLELIQTAANQTGSDTPLKLVHEAEEIIKQLYRRYDFNLDVLSARILVSPSYISSIFKKHTGSSIVKSITRYRMEEAKKMLLTTEDSLVKIAEAVGFNDPFYFSKCFKKYFGMSPSKLRDLEAMK